MTQNCKNLRLAQMSLTAIFSSLSKHDATASPTKKSFSTSKKTFHLVDILETLGPFYAPLKLRPNLFLHFLLQLLSKTGLHFSSKLGLMRTRYH